MYLMVYFRCGTFYIHMLCFSVLWRVLLERYKKEFVSISLEDVIVIVQINSFEQAFFMD